MRTHTMPSPAAAARLILALVAATLVSSPAAAIALEAEPVEGAADFRTAPYVQNGTYRDSLVTGEIVWYAVRYRNHTDLEIAGRVVDPQPESEPTLLVSFIDPALEEAATYEDVLAGSTAFEGEDVQTWYVRVELATPGRLGVVHDIELQLQGFEPAADLASCEQDPDCTAAERLEEVNAEIDGLEQELAALEQGEGLEVVETEVTDLESAASSAQAQADRAEARIAELCGGDLCEQLPPQDSVTPVAWVAVLGVVTAATVGVVAYDWRRRRAPAGESPNTVGREVSQADAHEEASARSML